MQTTQQKQQRRGQEAARTREAVIPDSPLELLNEYQTAKLLGCSVHTLRRDRWAGGGIPFVKLSAAVRYRRADIDAFIEMRVRRSTSDTGKV